MMKRHPFDPISFVSGAALLALGAIVLAGDDPGLLGTWLVPVMVIGVGVLLAAGWQSQRRRDDGSGDEATA